MKILFPSHHGASTAELAIICQGSGHQLFLVSQECGLGGSTKASEESVFGPKWGVKMIKSREQFDDQVGSSDVIFIASPEQYLQMTSFKKPLVVLGGIPGGGAKEFNKIGIRNLMTQSTRHAAEINCNNKLAYWKVLVQDDYKPPLYPEDKHGFCSFVHYMSKHWPSAEKRLEHLNSLLENKVINYGAGTPAGEVFDLDYMRKSKAVLHIKDGGMCCFAIARAMKSGTVVVMDRESVIKTYAEDVETIIVKDTIPKVAEELRRLDTDMEYLEDMSFKAYDEACSKFRYTDDLGRRFNEFLSRL